MFIGNDTLPSSVGSSNPIWIPNPSGAFSPSDIAGLKLWLQANAITGLGDGDAISTWPDSSGLGNDATGSGAARPQFKTAILGGQPVTRWAGAQIMALVSAFYPTSGWTVIVVSKKAASTNRMFSVGASVLGNPFAQAFYSDDNIYLSNRANYASKSEAGTAWAIWMTQNTSGDVLTFFKNGASQSVSGAANVSVGSFDTVGGRAALGGEYSTGDIAEIIVYDSVISSGNIILVDTYLDDKYLLVSQQVIFDGNSLTAGQDASSGANSNPPTGTIFPAVCVSHLARPTVAQQFGVGGQTTPEMTADAATQIDVLVSGTYKRNVLVAWEVTNDLFYGASHVSPADATTAYNNYVTYCQARQSAGWKVVAVTLLPRSSSGTPVDFETSRQTVNTNIRANWATFADALADVAADTRIGDAGDETDPTYYFQSGGADDNTHLIDAGYAIVATIVAAAIETLP